MDLATGGNQVRDEPLIDVERALVLGPVAHVVALGQHTPNLWSQTERVGQNWNTMYRFDARYP
jgi:hypothetical protein